MNAAELDLYLREVFPQGYAGGTEYRIEAVTPGGARLRMVADDRHLRPGGTVSGPSMMGLADLAFYAAILAQIGRVALAVTTSISFNFLRKPGPGDLICDVAILKLGSRLVVCEARLFSEGSEEAVCQATGTYSIPPRA